MPDNDEFETDDAFPDPGEDDQFKEMRRAANKAAKLAKENAQLQARLADLERGQVFAEAGLTLTPKQRAALLAAHDGDPTPEAYRATAVELGFAQAETDDGQQQRDQALAGLTKVSAATTGANPPPPLPAIHERIAQAEADHDWDTASALKAQMLTAAIYATSATVPLS